MRGNLKQTNTSQTKGTINKDSVEPNPSNVNSDEDQKPQRKRDDDYSIRQRLNNVKHFTEKTRI